MGSDPEAVFRLFADLSLVLMALKCGLLYAFLRKDGGVRHDANKKAFLHSYANYCDNSIKFVLQTKYKLVS